MEVKASGEYTLHHANSVDKTTRYYLLQVSTAAEPPKPTTNPPGGDWQTTEPSYSSESENTLYFVDLTEMSDGRFRYSEVSKSSSYKAALEAAKTATNYIAGNSEGLVIGDQTADKLGKNVLIGNDEIDIRNGTDVLARFKEALIELGLSEEFIIQILNDAIRFASPDNSTAIAHIGYGDCNIQTDADSSEIKRRPYYTFGERKIDASTGEISKIGEYSMVIGRGNEASGSCSYAEGNSTTASRGDAHAEGYYTTASAVAAHAEGGSTIASERAAHAEGERTTASGSNSHAEGNGTVANAQYSHAEGKDTTANGGASHVEGHSTTTGGYAAHAEGWSTTAKGTYAHAEGGTTIAKGYASHAEGEDTVANAQHSHSEGKNTTANGYASHTEGEDTIANGHYSHAGGIGTKASGEAQTVVGKYNIEDSDGEYLLIVGNGTSDDKRSNAFVVDKDGNIIAFGNIYTDGNFVARHNNNGIFLRYVDGTAVNAVFMNTSNELTIGYGQYANGKPTKLYGNDVSLYVKSANNDVFRPYWRKGDSFTMTFQGAGFVTNGSKEIRFAISVDRPIIGNPTVTVASVDGFIIRQEAKYLYGSAAGERVKPSSIACSRQGGMIIVTATMANTTNVTNNNAPVGVDASIKVTLS